MSDKGDKVLKDFGLRIKALRELKGLSQMELAEKCGYSNKAMISFIESGKRKINQERVQLLADALEVSPSELFGDSVDDAEFRRLKAYYDALNDTQRKTLVNYAEFLKGSDSNEDG